jgi:branched-chain amino acid transport system permease protein
VSWLRRIPFSELALPPFLFAAAGVSLTQVLDEYQQSVLTVWLIYGLLTLSLTLVWGQAGIFSFGQNAFFGVAGYAFGVIAGNLEPHSGETLTALIAAALLAGLFAAALGYFMFYGQVSDVYVAIITLALTLVLLAVSSSTSSPLYRIGNVALGGSNGMISIPAIELRLPGLSTLALDSEATCVFVVVLCALVYLAVRTLTIRPLGRILRAVAENETRCELLGYDARRFKLIAFAIGGVIAGLAGASYAGAGGFFNPDAFTLDSAAQVVIFVMVGGRTSLIGAFVGAIAISALTTYLGGVLPAGGTPLVLGAVLIAIVLWLPGGLVPTLQGALSRFLPTIKSPQLAPPGSLPEPREAAALMVQDVGKSFGGVAALESVSINFEPCQLQSIIGPNGAGKSTLFSVLTGQVRPDYGTVVLGRETLNRLRPHQRARKGIGIKLQVPAIYRGLTAAENIWLAAYSRSGNPKEADAATSTVLEQLGLVASASSLAGDMAHGDQQRIELGMLLASAPSVVLLDEPTAGMTRQETARMAGLVKDLARSATVVVVEHDMEFISQLQTPVTMLHQGQVFARGSYEELRANPQVLDVYLGRDLRAAS